MLKTILLNNDKTSKDKKFHTKSILIQAKNRNLLEQIDRNKQINNYCNKMRKASVVQKEDSSHHNNFVKSKDKRQQYSLNTSSLKQKNQFKSKSSQKIERKRQQIIKYSKLCTSNIKSSMSIERNMKKLLNSQSIKLLQKTKQSKLLQWRKGRNHNDQKIKSISNIIPPNQQYKDDVMLHLVDCNPIMQVQKEKQNKIKDLLKKSRQICQKHRQEPNYTLQSFVENQLNNTRLKHGRKTVGYLIRNQSNNGIADIREQQIGNIHRFFDNYYRQDYQYSNSMNTKQIQNFKNKYQIYNCIYKKTKNDFNNQIVNVQEIKQLTVKNIVYINQLKQQSNAKFKKDQIGKVMKKLHFYY